jgi:hypothetical protein
MPRVASIHPIWFGAESIRVKSLYDTTDFGAECRDLKVTPQVAKIWRSGGSASDARTTQALA